MSTYLYAKLWTYNEGVGKSLVERQSRVDLRNVLGGQRNIKRLDVRHEVLDLAATDDGENVWCLVHRVRDGH